VERRRRRRRREKRVCPSERRGAKKAEV